MVVNFTKPEWADKYLKLTPKEQQALQLILVYRLDLRYADCVLTMLGLNDYPHLPMRTPFPFSYDLMYVEEEGYIFTKVSDTSRHPNETVYELHRGHPLHYVLDW